MTKSHLKLVVSGSVIGPVAKPARPTRRPDDPNGRKHLTEAEVNLLLVAARENRYGLRDELMVTMAYRHGFRTKELCELEWSQIDFDNRRLHVTRAKNGSPSTHPLKDYEMRPLRKLQREQDPPSRFVFTSERGEQFKPGGFRTMIARLGKVAGISFKVHPHQLRHGCGHRLAMNGEDTRSIQEWLGHKNIHHTVKYTALSPKRFRDW